MRLQDLQRTTRWRAEFACPRRAAAHPTPPPLTDTHLDMAHVQSGRVRSLRSRLLAPWSRELLNKVPEITAYFWIIKVLCTTVGETASDNLSDKVGLGLTNTTYITGSVLLVTLFAQFRLRRYVPSVYWLAVVLISIVGTQIT